jgi:2'-hydroxyisoflavone reductase
MKQNATRREFLGTAGAGAMLGLSSLAAAQSGSDASPPPDPKRLRILVLGGTGQTGPHFVRRALAHGHEVTLFNRGSRSEELFPGVECLIGNRYPEQGEGLTALETAVAEGRRWDVCLDVWPHIPRLVEATAKVLQDNVDRYMFVSSVSVYTDTATKHQDETAAVGQAPDADDMEFNMALFGPFKAECENRVRRYFPDRNTIFRPALIIGPRDFSFRGVYWPVRVRDGGEVLAPGDGEAHIQNIDARDLVAFELLCMEKQIGGTFNVFGPHPNNPLTMRRLLTTCRTVADSDATFTWVPAEFLAEHGVGPWMQMPNWVPAEGDYAGFGWRSNAKAVAAGLTFRPLAETMEDTLQWFDSLSEEGRSGIRARAGITAEKEAEVLAAWHARDAE